MSDFTQTNNIPDEDVREAFIRIYKEVNNLKQTTDSFDSEGGKLPHRGVASIYREGGR